MKNKKTLLFLAFFVVAIAHSQEISPSVISGNGDYIQTPQGSVAWTIGEPVSETYTNTTHVTTMGFHQTEELILTSLIKEQGSDKMILVYPNPVQSELTINFGTMESGEYHLEITDALGKILFEKNTLVTEQARLSVVSLSAWSMGHYYLKINKGVFNKTIKINKVN